MVQGINVYGEPELRKKKDGKGVILQWITFCRMLYVSFITRVFDMYRKLLGFQSSFVVCTLASCIVYAHLHHI